MAPNLSILYLDSLPTPILILILPPLALITSWLLYQCVLSPLSKIPGPFLASISRLWLIQHSWNGDMHRTMIALHARHGTLVRTGPNEVSVASLPAVKKIYGAGSRFRKSDWYSVFQGHRRFDLFAERDDGVHAGQRRFVSGVYSMASLRDLESHVDDAVEVFMARMREREGRGVDMGKWAQLFTFDIVGELTFSKRLGFMDSGEDDGSMAAIKNALWSGAWIGQVPALYWVHDFLTPVFGNHLGITARHGSLRQFALREVEARKKRGGDQKDLLSKLFAVHKEKPEYDYNGVVSMATSNIFAGSDTTAISIRAIIYHLLKNPDCKRKLMEDIDQRRRNGTLSDPVKLEEADHMPYLQAIMYEALRLHPAVGMTLPRVVPPGGIEIDDTFIPAGTIVGVNPWVVHRNKQVYGDDIEVFRPERWMKEDVGDMHRFFFSFGAGARLCLGKNISWMEMSKLIPTLFMRYDLHLVDPDAELEETCHWFVMQEGLNVVLRPRHVDGKI